MKITYAILFPLITLATGTVGAPFVPTIEPEAPQSLITHEKVETVEILTAEDQIRYIAKMKGIDDNKFYTLIKCENTTLDPNKQSDLKYKFSDPRRGIIFGTRELSFGLAQIHLPDHPTITIRDATSAEFSLVWAAQHIKEGRFLMWKHCSKKAGYY